MDPLLCSMMVFLVAVSLLGWTLFLVQLRITRGKAGLLRDLERNNRLLLDQNRYQRRRIIDLAMRARDPGRDGEEWMCSGE